MHLLSQRCIRRHICTAVWSIFLAQVALSQDSDFQSKLQQNEKALAAGQQPPVDPLSSQIIKEAPAALLTGGAGDVFIFGDCKQEVTTFCSGVVPGQSRISKCLTDQEAQEEKGNVAGKKMSEDCKRDLQNFKMDQAENINANIPLAMACKADATKFCKDADLQDPGFVLACLRDNMQDLADDCKDQVFATQQQGAKDYLADADLKHACEADALSLCADVKEGEGRVQACLRGKRGKLSKDCKEELFRQEVENADDIRLSTHLFNLCTNDQDTFCKDVPPGKARIKDCLEEHREEPGFNAECKAELEKMMEHRATDFRLDSNLRELCADDIDDMCGLERSEMGDTEGYDARVIYCLQDFRSEIQGPKCKEQVHKLIQRAAQDIRMDEPLADACFSDRQKLCEDEPPGSARVIRCLQDKRESLSDECAGMLFDEEVKFGEDIDFKYPMKASCSAEIDKFCSSETHGQARVIRCLQEHLEETEMSKECRDEVEKDEIRSNQDYRLNFRLDKACQVDINRLCSDKCTMDRSCGGQVLRCLTDNQSKLSTAACKDEVFYFIKMEVNDYRNDAPLAEACRTDVDKHCRNVKPGQGRVHKCLQDHVTQLTENCRREELQLQILQGRDIRLRPTLHKACSQEISTFCKSDTGMVEYGKGKVFQCLQENIAQAAFGSECRSEVESRTAHMQEDYRLDYSLSSNCQNDVDRLCKAEQGKAHSNAAVLKCLVNQFTNVSEACQKEGSRAVRMALWEYRPNAAITGACDSDVQTSCQSAISNPKNRGVWSIGAVGRCLSRQLAEGQPLQPDCRRFVAVAAPKDVRELFSSNMQPSAVAERFIEIQQKAGIKAGLVNPAAQGLGIITLTGWVALAAIMALIIVAVAGIAWGVRSVLGVDDVSYKGVKQADV